MKIILTALNAGYSSACLAAGQLLVCLVSVIYAPVLFAQNTAAESLFYRHLNYLQGTAADDDILSQIMKDEKLQRLGKYTRPAQLLKGQIYLDKGLHEEAGKLFEKITDDNSADKKLKNEARFYLAKSLYHQGRLSEALNAFNQVKEPVSDEVRAEKQHLYSLILMSQGRYTDAAKYLRKNWWEAPGSWALYARLNLGVALIHSGKEEDGFNLIKQLSLREVENREVKNRDIENSEAQALIDKSNQLLGYLLLSQNKPADARAYLEKVRLDGVYSNMALLGAGWASARLQQYNQAVIPWLELQKKDMRDIPVQESLLTVPYAFEQMGLVKKSVRYYQLAVKAYASEMESLQSTMTALQQGQLAQALNKLDISSESGWHKSVDLASQGLALRYVRQMVEDDVFFNLILNYKEARLLKQNADDKITKISYIQDRLLNKAGIDDAALSHKNRDQIAFIQILSADLFKRSNQLQTNAQKNIDVISKDMSQRALKILQLRKAKLDVYLVQSRLALAQNYDRLKP